MIVSVMNEIETVSRTECQILSTITGGFIVGRPEAFVTLLFIFLVSLLMKAIALNNEMSNVKLLLIVFI